MIVAECVVSSQPLAASRTPAAAAPAAAAIAVTTATTPAPAYLKPALQLRGRRLSLLHQEGHEIIT